MENTTEQKLNFNISPQEIEVVIASYQENIWYAEELKRLGYKVTIYNTNGGVVKAYNVCSETKRLFNFRDVECVALPNTCKEANQYIHHMISRRDMFHPYTFFMQADLGWSAGNNFSEKFGADSPRFVELLSWLRIAPRTPFMPYRHLQVPPTWPHPNLIDEWNTILKPFSVPPITTNQSIGAQFMCSKEFLNRIPLEYLEKLMSICDTDPSFALKLEFAWPLVLDCYGQNWPIPEVNAPQNHKKQPKTPKTVLSVVEDN